MLDFGDELEEFALFAGRERARDHVAFTGVEGGQEPVDDFLGFRGDVYEQFAAVVGVGHALYEPALLERVEQRGHGSGRDEDSFGDH